MSETTRDSLLRIRSFLPSPIVRAFSIIHAGWDFYGPQTWLLLYYPLLYLAKVAKRRTVQGSEREDEALAEVGFATATTLSLALLSPLLYVLLLRYCFFESDFWNGKGQEENPQDSSHEVPDQLLHTDAETGLSKTEVIARRKVYGLNEIGHPRNWVFVLFRLSIGPANLLLEAAAVLAVLGHDWWDLLSTCGLLVLNIRGAIYGIREHDEVAQTLAWDCSIRAIVLREGTISEVTAKELVPGDIVHVSERSLIPAEGRIITMDSTLHVDQSNITGEDDPVEKQVGDTCYITTGVVRGDAYLTVIGTAYQTFVGRTLSLVGDPMPERQSSGKAAMPRHATEYQGVLRSIGGTFCALCIAPIVVNYIFGSSTHFWQETLELVVDLAIVALPASLSIIIPAYQGRGLVRLSDSGGLVNGQLTGIGSLAGIDVLCSDNTGTITENKLTVLEPYCISCDPEDLILTACLSNSPDKQNLDPIDEAMAASLKQYPQARARSERHKVLNWQPFDVETKRIQSSVESPDGERMLCVKGAPNALLETYLQDHPDKEDIREKYTSMARDFAGRGARSLAVARQRENDKWELLGLAPLLDQPRSDTASAVRVARTLGVTVKMFTGNAAAIAESTAQSVGMGANILDAESIDAGEEAPVSELTVRIEEADAYAEVYPVHKEKIVRVLQNHGHLVAATGDGVADVPTLRRADCGIAVEGATEKAQSAADIVFNKNPGLASIVRAIQMSRQTFQQVYNYIIYRTTISLHLMLVMLWLFAAYTEVLDVRLLILDIHIGDIVALALVSDNATTPFSKNPQRWSFRKLLVDVMPLTIVLAIGSWLSMLVISDQAPNTRSQVLFLQIVLSDHWMSFLTHTDGRFWAYNQNRQVLWTLLCMDLLATLLCVAGWVGQGHGISILEASWAWVVSFGTFSMAASVRFMISDGQLLDRPLTITGEKSE